MSPHERNAQPVEIEMLVNLMFVNSHTQEFMVVYPFFYVSCQHLVGIRSDC